MGVESKVEYVQANDTNEILKALGMRKVEMGMERTKSGQHWEGVAFDTVMNQQLEE